MLKQLVTLFALAKAVCLEADIRTGSDINDNVRSPHCGLLRWRMTGPDILKSEPVVVGWLRAYQNERLASKTLFACLLTFSRLSFATDRRNSVQAFRKPSTLLATFIISLNWTSLTKQSACTSSKEGRLWWLVPASYGCDEGPFTECQLNTALWQNPGQFYKDNLPYRKPWFDLAFLLTGNGSSVTISPSLHACATYTTLNHSTHRE